MSVEIEGLEFQVEAKSDKGADGIDKLANSFKNLKSAIKGGTNLNGSIKQLEKLNQALSGLHTDKLESLGKAMESLNKAGNIKIPASVPKRISEIGNAMKSISQSDIDRMESMSRALQGIVWNGAWDQDPLKYDIKTYASPTSTTVIETVKPTEGTGGTELTTLNSGQRMCYGSNNYKESAVRGWLNSDKVAGSVWTPATNYDRPPSWVSNKAGFMNGMDADFLAVIGKTTKVTCRNNVTDGGGSDTTKDKFFLLSRRELFMGDEVSSVKEGEPYPYYSDYSDYTSPNTGADSNRVKYKNGSPQWQWERTPYAGSSGYVRFVDYAGSLNNSVANNSGGVAPACNVI